MSNYQDPDQVYDLERDFLAPARSPGLQPVNINYRPVVTPPPLVPNYPSSDSSDEEDDTGGDGPSERRTRRKSRIDPSLSDGVLIRSLDPNQVELARIAEKHALASASEQEEEEDSQGETREPRMTIQHDANQDDAVEEGHLNDNDGDFPMVDSPGSVHDAGQTFRRPVDRDAHHPDGQPRTQRLTPTRHEKPTETSETTFQCRLAPLAKENLRLHLGDTDRDLGDSLITSPNLGKYTMTPRFPDPDVILPAIQKSPPRSSPASSPQHKQTLPSLRTHLGDYEAKSPGFAGLSPIMGRPSPGPAQLLPLGPSPPFHQPTHATMSPPALPAQFTWRSATRDSSISGSSEYTPTSSGAVSTPASSIVVVQSPATSISVQTLAPIRDRGESVSVSDAPSLDSSSAGAASQPQHQPTSEEEEQQQQQQSANGLSASSQMTADGSYQCLYQGCTAPPFQTQYLLNSHMNVHSETRTHFCHVEGCPHGPGGKGFKRKNEMIR